MLQDCRVAVGGEAGRTHKVMQSPLAGAANVHAWPLAHWVQPFKNLHIMPCVYTQPQNGLDEHLVMVLASVLSYFDSHQSYLLVTVREFLLTPDSLLTW